MTSRTGYARFAGLLYILASLVGFLRLIYIPDRLFVVGNAEATANNVASHEFLFRLGIASNLVASVLWLFVPLALYRLLKDVDHWQAVLMVILGGLMQVPLFLCNTVNDAAALLFARGEGFLSAFEKPQRDALARLFLNLHHQLDLANMMFAGLWLLPFGLLVYRSRFLPRVLGVWLMTGCFGWLAFSFTGFLFPAHDDRVFRMIQPFTLSEVAMMVWLVIRGAKEPIAAMPA